MHDAECTCSGTSVRYICTHGMREARHWANSVGVQRQELSLGRNIRVFLILLSISGITTLALHCAHHDLTLLPLGISPSPQQATRHFIASILSCSLPRSRPCGTLNCDLSIAKGKQMSCTPNRAPASATVCRVALAAHSVHPHLP